MQKVILLLLAFFAKAIIRIHKPYIIGVTGTVGKTTITAHIAAFLTKELGKKNVMYSPYHYNGEYGLPLTIIGAKTGGKNPFLWITVFVKALFRCVLPYPKYLILEYGIDSPGEMDFLLDIAIPDIAILTEVLPNHIQQFGTFDLYRKEKLKITLASRELIIHDSQRSFVTREALFYGLGAMSDIYASHVTITPEGTRARVHADHHEHDIFLPVFGEFQVENILPLYAIAAILGLNTKSITSYAARFVPESGRSGILKGMHGSLIIDGSYNGGYLSLHSGILSLRAFLHSHRLIVLMGDMRELGKETEHLHRELAEEISRGFPHESDIAFFCVGPHMKEYVYPVLQQKFMTEAFLSSVDAGKKIEKMLRKDPDKPTIVYVKGSQNTIFLEEGIKIFLDEGVDVQRLCRQSPEWLKKKEIFFDSLKSL